LSPDLLIIVFSDPLFEYKYRLVPVHPHTQLIHLCKYTGQSISKRTKMTEVVSIFKDSIPIPANLKKEKGENNLFSKSGFFKTFESDLQFAHGFFSSTIAYKWVKLLYGLVFT
jgi:hypothetical protein